MTHYNKTWKNQVWLLWSALQLPLILCEFPFPLIFALAPSTKANGAVIDGLEFFPKWTYEPAGSPLHFFHDLKSDYIAEHRDPIALWSPATASGHDSWMGLFIYLEWALALPVVLFTVYRLGVQRKGTSGAHELVLLVYSFEVALSTLVCIHDVFYWDESYTAEARKTLILNMYSPWLIIRKFPVLGVGILPR